MSFKDIDSKYGHSVIFAGLVLASSAVTYLVKDIPANQSAIIAEQEAAKEREKATAKQLEQLITAVNTVDTKVNRIDKNQQVIISDRAAVRREMEQRAGYIESRIITLFGNDKELEGRISGVELILARDQR